MRLLIASLVGLVAAACSLSFNPDLPSAEEHGGGIFDDNNETTGGDGDILIGDGDADAGHPPNGDGLPTGSMGGQTHSTLICLGLGGEGGSPSACEGKP